MFLPDRRNGFLLAIGVALASAAFSAPANAQFFGWAGDEPLRQRPGFYREATPAAPPRVIQNQLQRQGYRVIGPLRFNGDVILAEALSSDGRRMRLVIDPYNGLVIQRFARAEPRPPANVFGLEERDGLDDPHVIRGPSTGYLGDGSLAPPPAARTPPKPRAKPKAVARAEPPIQSLKSPPLGDAPPPAPVARAKPKAAKPQVARLPEPSTTARSAPAEFTQPQVTVTPASQARNAPVQPAPVVVDQVPKPAPPPVPAPAVKQVEQPAAPARPGYANGVPINPLD